MCYIRRMFKPFKWPFGKKRAYFDYAAATPLDSRVADAMKPFLDASFANPSSLYVEGVRVHKAVEAARRKVAGVLQAKPEEIIFTGGGTESNNIAILGTYFHYRDVLKKDKIHFVATSIEHSSVLEALEHAKSLGAKVTYVSPGEDGIVRAEDIAAAIRPETVLVSVMYANNEIGTIQPIREIRKCAKMPITLHVDACQGGSYLPLHVHDLGADLLTLDGSKIYGPKGSGILYRKAGIALSPIMFGGGQESGMRPGTENPAAIVGFAEALAIAQNERLSEGARLKMLRDGLQKRLLEKVKDLKVNGNLEKRLPNNLSICKSGLDAEYAVLRLDALGFALSSVTSCKNQSEDSSSYVIEELYGDDSCSKSSLRITLGRFTTEKEVYRLEDALLTVLT